MTMAMKVETHRHSIVKEMWQADAQKSTVQRSRLRILANDKTLNLGIS